ncbi:DUF1295 domain-containing protein [Histomonas meleagridis]|uniref:DUF1295 domain-containing protein n=1 Tax=Histomonas meleagridis TaxID=135588 RepID=UPI0035597EAC|nr:DUF1295 domain-containing protein [Histomonas meleagridis]KAH0797816.1 DUF1295 domain-containing protein [Histomonas meleagridis]
MGLESIISFITSNDPQNLDAVLIFMTIIAVIVFIALYFINAGYGMFTSKSWGIAIPNRIAWVLMESPVFFIMLFSYLRSSRKNITLTIIFLFFELHYFQRSFVFPMLFKTKSKMPISIMLMGVTFNLFNGYIQGKWLFYVSPEDMYTSQWLHTPQFIFGTIMFFVGMAINWHSDHVIRSLRKPGDTRHYLPKRGMYKYVTSANYFGEIVEWTGFAILTWSKSGLVFVIWTSANLVPRANSIWKHYKVQFKEEFAELNPKRIFPFIY